MIEVLEEVIIFGYEDSAGNLDFGSFEGDSIARTNLNFLDNAISDSKFKKLIKEARKDISKSRMNPFFDGSSMAFYVGKDKESGKKVYFILQEIAV